MEKRVEVERHGKVAVVTLANPAAHNALDKAMVAELSRTLRDLDDDATARAVVLRGAGRNFCAGGDISTFDEGVAGGRDYVYAVIGLCRQIEHARTPVIAAVHGRALGGGFELALACDDIVAAESAQFAVPELRVGAVPGFALVRLGEIGGRALAKRMAWTGAALDARAALANRVVGEVVPDEDLRAVALARATVIAAQPRVAAETVKALANASVADRSLVESVTSSALQWGTRALAEGKDAFFGKRAPVFPDDE
ncbi:enoyl-CoA hydratase-related protein [Pseudonocardia ailaonensis]|uniref:Enoyl-CoA hydratase-related protein n=1 Tax=Pseudonocardia ailaonensis TaxID=367279 RepID=A0ABN2NGX8_9PSEU